MMPHCKRESQFELFAEHAPAAQPTPKLALPIQRSDEIDVQRASRILGVVGKTIYVWIKEGLIRGYLRGSWRIDYQSIVDFCDQLCVRYCIPRKTPAPPMGRRRDRDLLPFPLDETTSITEVAERLDRSTRHVQCLIDEGVLTAYRLRGDVDGPPWRIHEASVDRYIASLHARVPAQRKSSHTTP